ncbi:MAG: hypothetical protein R2824_00185 [Saprospiraceae bacterium]|nr:hypothetical protein [Lewinella sp.]
MLLLISPVFTLVYTLKQKDKRFTKWMLTLFSTVYASTFNIEGIGDGTVHWERVYSYYVGLSFPQFLSDLKDILLFKTNHYVNEDVYIHFLSYLTGEVFAVPGLFFVFVGFIYGYFFSASMVAVFDRFPSIGKHFHFFILAVYFIAILNLQSMNTVRTWTGFWVLFYGVLQYQTTGKKKYLMLLFLPPFIHVGYFIMCIPIWIVTFFPLKKQVLIILYGLSFATTLFSPAAVLSQLSKYEVGAEKIDGYYIEEEVSVADRLESGGNKRWYKTYRRSGILAWAMVVLSLAFILNGAFLTDMNRLEEKLFSMGLLSKVLSNTTWFIFALSNRSEIISSLFILGAIVIYWQRKQRLQQTLKMGFLPRTMLTISVLLIIPVFFFYISNTLEFTSVYILAFPSMAWIDESLRLTMREFLGFFL